MSVKTMRELVKDKNMMSQFIYMMMSQFIYIYIYIYIYMHSSRWVKINMKVGVKSS